MNNFMKTVIIIFSIIFTTSISYCSPVPGKITNWKIGKENKNISTIIQQVQLSPNNISSFYYNTGIFDQDKRTANTPGFEWPKGSGHQACFSAGLSIGTFINGSLTEASCSYTGEYGPGYINNSSGSPVVVTNSDFKIYKVSAGDNAGNNPDYANWYKMIPYGAPYDDVNHNGIYDNGIDIPGIKNAASTLFGCLTDGTPANHIASEGFGGGTAPLFCEMHFTAWAYNNAGMEDVQFVKWVIINKNVMQWNNTFMAIVSDPDLGYGNDDFIGCDTIQKLGYCYNGDNDDSGNLYGYGANPPAFGIDFLKTAVNRPVNPNAEIGMTAFDYFTNSSPVICERDPNPDVQGAYNYLKGYKLDGTPWVNAQSGQITKKCYPGAPEVNIGWTERTGSVQNCGGGLTGTIIPSNPSGDRRFIMSSGADNFTMPQNDSQTVIIAQLVARGTNNWNSVTKLKQLDAAVKVFYSTNVSVNNISSEIPSSFSLYQNYPNPFNPTTNIKFDMVRNGIVNLKVNDVSGKEVATLINNEMVTAGTNIVSFDANNFASGIYFYTLTAGTFSETKRMVLVK